MSLTPYSPDPSDVDVIDVDEVDDDRRRMAVLLVVVEVVALLLLVALGLVAGALAVVALPVEAVLVGLGLLGGVTLRLWGESQAIALGLRRRHDWALDALEGLAVDLLDDHRMYTGKDDVRMVRADDTHPTDEPYNGWKLRHQRARIAQWRWNRKYG